MGGRVGRRIKLRVVVMTIIHPESVGLALSMCVCVCVQHNQFKMEIISSKIPDGTTVTAYRNGPLIDLCRGPHIPHTGVVKAMKITKVPPPSLRLVCAQTTTCVLCVVCSCSIQHIFVVGVVLLRGGMRCEQNSASYWGGKAENPSLQRVYGISYPEKDQMKEYMKLMEEAAKRDHRKIGTVRHPSSVSLLHPATSLPVPSLTSTQTEPQTSSQWL